MLRKRQSNMRSFAPLIAALLFAIPTTAQRLPAGRAARPGPMLDGGYAEFHTPDLTVRLVRSSGTVAALAPKDSGFSFTPSELLAARSVDGYDHLGDLDLRLRVAGETAWRGFSTAFARHPVRPLPLRPGDFERDDLAPTFAPDLPLEITRSWSISDGVLVLRFTLRNPGKRPVEIGALGIPLIFDNILSGKTLEQAHAECSFSDPSIALDSGYVQVTRLNGHGPALLVVPDGHTPFEAYRPIPGPRGAHAAPVLFSDLTPRSNTFEGFYEWMVASAAYQQNEWKNAQPWNPATTIVLAPGEQRTIGLRFLLAPSIRGIEATLIQNRRPVAVGIPGYILPQDIDASLFLKYPRAIRSISVEPAGAVAIKPAGVTPHGWRRYSMRGRQWGRARVTVTYADGLIQTIPYQVIKPEAEAVSDLGNFLFTRQWFDVPNDPFHRSPSIMSYDCQANAIVTQDSRVWIAGLSDEAGAGSWLAAAMKEYEQPVASQVAQLEDFVDKVLWGELQFKDGPEKYGVRKSLFYYQPDKLPPDYYRKDLNWSSWTSWNQAASERVDRSYNYPHVVAAYWALYRLARDHQGLVTHHDWQWYLTQAYQTSMAMTRFAPGLAQYGQMEGDIFLAVLRDLRREGMTDDADALEAAMRARADVWQKLAYPFGSEMPWDSTGQEEVYAWTRFFGMDSKARITLDAIIGYMPAIPSWGYNGSARRYWDFLYAGKYPRIERQLHHYGSGINAIPVLDAYRSDPGDVYLLRIGYGGAMGAIAGIDQRGCASEAFHSYPDMMIWDPYTGDYGTNFFGHAWATGTYVVHDPEFGWLALGGNLTDHAGQIRVVPRDSFRQRIYLAPLGLWLTLDSGSFQSLEFNPQTHAVRIQLAPADRYTPTALLRIAQPAAIPGVGKLAPAAVYKLVRGAYAIPLGSQQISVRLRMQNQ